MRNEARDLLQLVLVPGLAALLPWPLCFRLFRWLCRVDLLYRGACEEALAHARSRGWVHGDPEDWKRRRRLVTLIDHADFFLALTRSDRWMQRNLIVSGAWPDPSKAAMLCTFHWGAGMWALRHARSSGLRAHALVAPQLRKDFPGQTVNFLYCKARVRSVRAALDTDPIEIAGSPREILRTVRSGEQIVAAIDVPPDQVAASESIDFVGLRARVPRGLLRFAAESGVPVSVYLTGIRLADGKRMLSIHHLGTRTDPGVLIREVFAFLEDAIRRDAAAWHFWAVAPRFFEPQPQSTAG